LPFLATAIFFDRATTAFAVVKRHYSAVLTAGGLVLIVMGVLIWTGELAMLNAQAQRLMSDLGLDFFNEV